MEHADNIARQLGSDDALPDDYEERAVQSAFELDELVRLRAELSWADWKAHARFKKDRVIREAQRRFGVPASDAPPAPANEIAHDIPADPEAELARDEAFHTVCDLRREAWITALESGDDEDCD